jgi:hypothetical protein
MADRPIFVPMYGAPSLVREISFSIPWASGFAPVQKQKNIRALHKAAAAAGYEPLLEVSTKSDEVAGRHLSAFHLKVRCGDKMIPLESAYQGSKVFDCGGPYTDLYEMEARDAKRDCRLRESGRLIRFRFNEIEFPLEPMTAFYDWLYISAIYPYRDWLQERLSQRKEYAGFTDIEFNPAKSVNCQARSCALFVSLVSLGILDQVISSPEAFVVMMDEERKRAIGADGRRLAV